ENDLRRYGLTFDQVAVAVRKSSLDLPGGSVRTEGGEILLRTKGQAYVGTEFENLVVLSRPDGTHLRLGDVATVVDGFAETDQFARFDGHDAVLVQIYRTGDQAALTIADAAKEYLKSAQGRMPEGIHLTPWQDASKVLKDRLSLLLRNGAAGFVLVFISLSLFLRFRLAFWVSLGIPISFMGAIWLMPHLGVSVNLISLFAFIVVLGIVVDDAIVAGENIYTHQQRHRQGLKGSIEGAREVATPVIFAVLTTVAAFFPLLNVDGAIGKVMRTIPLIVIPCLLFSLVESLWILPAHLSHMKANPKESAWRKFQSFFADGLEWYVRKVYAPSLDVLLRWRYVTVAIGIATLLITLGTVKGGYIRFEFFPAVEADYISAALTMPQGTPAEQTSEVVRLIEASAFEAKEDFKDRTGGEDLFLHVSAAVGDQPYSVSQQRNAGTAATRSTAGHLGEVTIELSPAENRTFSSTELADRWRELTGTIPDAVELTFSASLFSPGDDIDVQLTGPDLVQLRSAADAVKKRLLEYAGVSQIADSFREGKKEVKLKIKPQAETLGLTQSDLGRQVRQAFYGEEAQRIQRGRDDIRVMVRYPASERRSLGDMENMRIRTPDGAQVPFGEVAEVQTGRGYSTIKRVDRRRSVNVTADVDPAKAATDVIVADLAARVLPEILAEHPGVFFTFEGQKAEQRDTMGGLKKGFALALVMIFALLAIPLRSYVQPLIIMLAIPFGLVGAIWGHLLMGMNLTIMSMFGLVALAGVVVNDSLVMVDFVNRRFRETGDIREAVRLSGAARFRPIILTSLTTFAGLSPLLLEKSMQARFLIPMAISLAFGVMFSTVITLVLVPSGYLILEDLRSLLRRLLFREVAVEQE
ncbi:MAG: efflux RND transporter permease subunit, partial [Acidobacteria bacterium]|nr:efflux RND transporter permease subunit [Candidatus Polarisedimenticola svalbardensis]